MSVHAPGLVEVDSVVEVVEVDSGSTVVGSVVGVVPPVGGSVVEEVGSVGGAVVEVVVDDVDSVVPSVVGVVVAVVVEEVESVLIVLSVVVAELRSWHWLSTTSQRGVGHCEVSMDAHGGRSWHTPSSH